MKKKVIFGLGNYGTIYKNTRHNIGFEVLEKIVAKQFLGEGSDNQSFENKKEWEVFSTEIENKEVFFIKIKGFINNSGVLIKNFKNIMGLNNSDLMLIHDDVSMEFSKLRLRRNSSSGGHNGVKSAIEELGSKEFCRIKIGVGRKQSEDLKNWVLGKFTSEEINKIDEISHKTAQILLNWIREEI